MSEGRSGEAGSASFECVIGVDAEGRVTAFNEAAEKAFGTRRGEVVGRSFAELVSRRSDEEELRELRKRLQVATEAASLGTWSFDLRTGKGWYSDRAKEIMGLLPEFELTARSVKSFVHPEDWDKVSAPYYSGVPETTVETEYRIVRPSGEIRWIYALGAATKDEDGVTRSVDGVHVDITERKLAEIELVRSREALHQSEKLAALGSLLAGVSHELNNPLAAIVGQAQMLEEDCAGTPIEARARKISAAAERCARIVQTFLAMARRREPQRSRVDVNALAAAALELADYGLRTAGIAVEAEYSEALPAAEGDKDQLHQVLINIIINAQQAMEEAGGQHVLTLRTWAADDGSVAIDVGDSGPGIPPEVAARIFEPFFTTKPQGSGTGVGLSFSHGVIAAHGGSLSLIPAERGAVFRILLPAAAENAETEEPAGAAAPMAAAKLGRALIIDDETDVADTLRELVEREGYEVTTVADGAAALAAVEEGHDLIFSDLRMPGMSGPEFFRRLSADRPGKAERVAFVTGDTLGGAMADFLADCGRPVLEKPFTVGSVRDLIPNAQRPARGLRPAVSEGAHIVVVDDDEGVRSTVAEYLVRNGFAVSEADGGDALRKLMAERPIDLAILDVNMPGDDGLTLAREIRSLGPAGIIMLTAKGDDIDKVVGLEVGADDYITKPYNPRELLARIRAVLRRVSGGGGGARETATMGREVRVGKCLLNLDSRKLYGPDGGDVPLTAMEFDLLRTFVEHPNRVLSRDQLLDMAHHKTEEPFDRSIDTRITRIRRKIEADPAKPECIKTVRSAGYIFIPACG